MDAKETIQFSLWAFIKKRWKVFSILAILPIVVITVYIILLINRVCDISDLGSMLGGVLAYIGTVSLGTTSVWQTERQRIENKELFENQYFEANKGVIQISTEIIFSHIILVIKNIGKSIIERGSILFDEKWLEEFERFDEAKAGNLLKKSLSSNLVLAPNQEIRFYLHEVGTNDARYKFLTEETCNCSISYYTLNKEINEQLILNFHSILQSFYGLNVQELSVGKLNDTGEKIAKELGTLNRDLQRCIQKNKQDN